jgi:hypothetical protein
MRKDKLPKIPTTYLPEGWDATAAEKHNVSSNTVQRIVYGLAASTAGNKKIWDAMVELALDEKEKFDLEQAENVKRLALIS